MDKDSVYGAVRSVYTHGIGAAVGVVVRWAADPGLSPMERESGHCRLATKVLATPGPVDV